MRVAKSRNWSLPSWAGRGFAISALNGRYIGDLLDLVLQKIPVRIAAEEEESDRLRLVLWGCRMR
jgi:predicted GTPase